MRYLVKLGKLKEKTEFLEEKLDKIDEQIYQIKKIKSDLIWEGSSREVFNIKYDDYINHLMKIEYELIKIIAFFKSFYTNYNDEYLRLKNKYIRMLEESEIHEFSEM